MSTNINSVPSYLDQTLSRFRNMTRKLAFFHILFFALFISELLILLIFLPFLAKSFLLAATIALTVLTIFAYFVLRFYFQTKKPEQFLAIRDQFLQSISPSSSPLSIVQPFYLLIHSLEGQEFHYYSLPASLHTLAPLVRKFSVWAHWEDLHLMKELLYTSCIHSLIQAVKHHPTHVDLHLALASAYCSFYKIYQLPSHEETYAFIASAYASSQMTEAFQRYARLAIEELHVVLHFRPNDPSALAQLGPIYHDLNQKEEEKKIYELLLQISPQDSTTRHRLGMLYFQLGSMADGLKIYDSLLKMHDPRAQELMEHYGQFQNQ